MIQVPPRAPARIPLPPTPRPPDGLDETLRAFLRFTEPQQLAFVECLDAGELRTLYGLFLEALKQEPDLGRLRAWPRMLELLWPDEYLEAAQDADLRLSLTPEALRELRSETPRELLDVLKRPAAQQVAFLDSLDAEGLRDLWRRLERHANRHGQVELYDLVKERLGL